jgi:tetratricopeptide (TPR) repeat protein
MIAEKWEQIKDLFEQALDCSPEERRSFLADLTGKNPTIAAEVVQLLHSYEQAGDFLAQPCCLASDFLEDLETEQQRFSSGDILCGRFRIVSLIGRGGMGEVYKAWDEELEDHVALKTLRLEISTHELFTSRFRREIQLARKVTHPNVCRIFDSFKHPVGDGTYISLLSMELLQGQTLGEYLNAKGRLTAAEAMPLVRQIIAGLSAIHAAGIVHRDLKPSNLVLVPDGAPAEAAFANFQIKITDFGIAGRQPDGLSPEAQTEVSKLMGTPDYMAPEQLEHARASVQSDIYSLGLVLYEMVTGVKPFAGTSAWKRITADPPPARKLSVGLPERWNNTITCALQRNTSKRPRSLNELLALFDTPPPRRSLWRLLFGTAASLCVILAFLIMRPHHVRPEAQMALDSARIAVENQSKDGFMKAIEEYKRATSMEPHWAQPWAELAYAYAAAGNSRYIEGRVALQESRQAAKRALQLDPKLAKANAALGWTQSLDFEQWQSAEASFRAAIASDSSDGQIHYWFGVHLRKKGLFQEAEAEDQLALRLTHQRDQSVWCELAFLYWTSGQISRLHEHMTEQLKLFPNVPATRFLYARLLKLEGSFSRAEDELSFAEKLGLNPLTVLVERASLKEYEGDIEAARRDIKQIVDAAQTQEVDGLLLAGDYAGLHDYDAAFQTLELAYQRKDSTLLSIATSPVIEPLKKDPRYKSLLAKLHFPT